MKPKKDLPVAPVQSTDPEDDKTELELFEEQTEREIFDDDDFIGDLEED